MNTARLSVDFFQLMDDRLFKKYRDDGLGWDWSWADWQRDWMNETPSRYAYRCLPLTIMNQTGWWVKAPVGFTAIWDGGSHGTSIKFEFDDSSPDWPQSINSQFGHGIITWNGPFLIRTKPQGSRLLVCGPPNYFRPFVQPLTALIESDWMSMSFTMNYKISVPHQAVRFEAGEPLFQVIPLISNVCADLENAEVRYRRLAEDPETHKLYHEWSIARSKFHEMKAKNEIKQDLWQKDYFQGRDITGREADTDHKIKLKAPQVVFGSLAATEVVGHPSVSQGLEQEQPMSQVNQTRPRPRPRRQPNHWFQDAGSKNSDVQPADEIPEQTKPSGIAACPITQVRSEGSVASSDHMPSQNELLADSQSRTGSNGTLAANGRSEKSVESSRTAPLIDDEWRRWIAECLMLECDGNSILQGMLAAGFDPNESTAEIQAAFNSPYVKGSELLRNRLKKREWLLSVYRKINRINSESDVIPRRHKLSRGQFLNEYYSTNRPVIITGMMDDWPALKKWNLDFFEENFGDREVEVQSGRNSSEMYELQKTNHLKKLRFGEFVNLIRKSGPTNDFYLTAANNSSNKAAMPELWKDVVQIPEYLDPKGYHDGFFWMGPAGTITPFHHDLTNNFMAQVIGRKKIKIAPSWDIPLMQNEINVFCKVDGRVVPAQPQPDINQPQIIECILDPGEILFLPIGSLHYVEGLEFSVTMSFTNFVFRNDFADNYHTNQRV